MLEKNLVNYSDGLWAITNIIPRTDYKPTVRRLIVPGHNFDEKRNRRDRRRETNALMKMMSGMRLSGHQAIGYHGVPGPIFRANSYYK